MKKLVWIFSALVLSACDQDLSKFVDVNPPKLDLPSSTEPPVPTTPNSAGSMKVSPGAAVSSGSTLKATLHVTPNAQNLKGSTVGFQGGVTRISR